MHAAEASGKAGRGRMGRIAATLERINACAAALSAWSLLAITLIVTFEVASRYAFNRPTIWAWDVNTQLMMLMLMLGMAEVYRRDAHVRVDVFIAHLSPRRRALLDALCAPVMFIVALAIAWTGWTYFLDSYQRLETASTLFAPPLYPIKFTLPLGGALLLIQAAIKLMRDLALAFGLAREGAAP